MLKGQKLNRPKPLFFQYGAWQVVRDRQWKLVQQNANPWELYDLSRDRTETRNLAAQQPGRVKAMTQQWQDWYRDCTGADWMPKPNKKKNKKVKK